MLCSELGLELQKAWEWVLRLVWSFELEKKMVTAKV
jgi:hypothetical protein